MTKIELASGYVRQYADQLLSGAVSKRGLAKLMMEENPGRFTSLDDARRLVRFVTSSASGSNESDKHIVMEFKSTISHGLKAIQSDARPQENFILPPGVYGVVSDIHIPYHDGDAMEVAFDYIKAQGIENILLNGDILDCYALSKWDKDPSARSFEGEINMLLQFFDWLRANFSGRLIYKLGNHEHRLERYLLSGAPALAKFQQTQFESLARFSDYGIEKVESHQIIKAGSLNIIHGHEFGESTFSPVNAARGLFLRAKCSILAGHSHQTSNHHESNVNGDAMACWSTGALCDLRPSYRPFAFTKWNHGFAVVDVREDGSFRVDNKRIIGSEVF